MLKILKLATVAALLAAPVAVHAQGIIGGMQRGVAAGNASAATSAVIDVSLGTDVTTFGAKGDGVTDDTAALQLAANSNQVLWFPKTSAFYKITRVITLKNSVYSDGAEIRILQDATIGKSIFRVVQNAEPLTIDGFVLNGLYTTGSNANEYSHGIELRSAVNVTISNNTIENTFGNNIYLAYGGTGTAPCQNITISNNTLSNPYRNNITLIHADGVTIKDNTITKTFNYVHSIDLEPNLDGISNNKNVTIDNNNINCPGQAISVSPNNTVPTSGIRITNNVVSALANFVALWGGPKTAPSPYSNVDNTVHGAGYYSLSLQGSTTLAVNTNNTFN